MPRPLSLALPRIHVRKVLGETAFPHHLLEFVISRPASEAFLAGPAREPHSEGAGESAVCLSPSRFGLVQPFASPSFQSLPTYLFTPFEGVVLSRDSSTPSEGVGSEFLLTGLAPISYP